MKQPIGLLLFSLSLGLPAVMPGPVVAQGISESLPTAVVTPEVLESKIAEVEAASGLEEQAKTRLLELYRKTLGNLRTAASNREVAEAFQRASETAPAQAQSIREEMEEASIPDPEQTLGVDPSTSLRDVEQRLQKENADLAAVKAKRGDVTKRLNDQEGRSPLIQQRLIEARQEQDKVATQLKLPTPADEGPATEEARRWALETRYQALSAEIRMLDQELLSQPGRMDLLSAEQDRAVASLEWIRKRVKILEELVTGKRQEEADQAKAQAEATRQGAEGKHPLVIGLAERNAALSEEIADTVSGLDDLANRTDLAVITARRIETDFESARETIQIGGLSQELGHMLWQQRHLLPDQKSFRREAEQREETATQTGVRRLRHRQEQKRLRDLETYVAVIAEEAAAQTPELRQELRGLAVERQTLLVKAVESDDFYLRKLGALEAAQQRLLGAIEGFDEFLNVHLLWVRSASRAEFEELGALSGQVWLILSPADWLDVVRTLLYQATHAPVFLLLALALGALLWGRKRIVAGIQNVSDRLGKPTTDHFGHTAQALALTLIAAAAWPLAMAVAGWQLKVSVEGTSFTSAVGGSLIAIALQVFYLRGFRMICIDQGLASAHFRWPESSLGMLRKELDRLTWIYLPAAAVSIVAFHLDPLNAGWAIGRIAFLIMAGSLAFAFYRLLHPSRGVLAGYNRRHGSRLRKRLRWLWFSILVTSPLVLGGVSVLGYLYTGGTLLGLLIQTSWVAVGLVILAALAERWLRMARRQLAYEAAVEQRQALAEQAAGHLGEDAMSLDPEEPEVDLVALSETSRKLLNTTILFVGFLGLWMIWSEVLPALLIFDDVSLWHHRVMVGGEEQLLPVTLTDIGLALVYLAITVILAKQLPAVLEIILLHNSEMSAGGRYTVTTLTTYTIVTVGLVLVFNVIGVDWSKLQWLVAALGVGIGFGLQEIVANFISGIIILFERPVRIGDVVSVGDTDGTVTRIRIRATTIRNWDGKELLVPNKEFITGRLLNWSLSDQTTRLLVAVGVAYGSNVPQVMELLEEAAREHANVLSDPAPSVIFQDFGESALNLVLRCFVETVDLRMATISELNQAINDKFTKAGVVIAFPQRDLHLGMAKPLRVQVENAGPARPESGSAE